MFSCAVSMNCRSVAEQVWTTCACPVPPMSSTSTPRTMTAETSPAAADRRGFTLLVSALGSGRPDHPFGVDLPASPLGSSEDQGAVPALAPHPDGLVDTDRGGILRAHEQADRRHLLEQQAE